MKVRLKNFNKNWKNIYNKLSSQQWTLHSDILKVWPAKFRDMLFMIIAVELKKSKT